MAAIEQRLAKRHLREDTLVLYDLGTLTANTMQVTEGGATFKLQTQPTPMQQRCFELLGVTPRL